MVLIMAGIDKEKFEEFLDQCDRVLISGIIFSEETTNMYLPNVAA